MFRDYFSEPVYNVVKLISNSISTCLIALFNLIQEPRWNETTNMFSCTYISLLGRYDICSPVECWKTTVLTDTCVKNRLLWIFNFHVIVFDWIIYWRCGQENNCFCLQKFITNKSWDCGSEYFAGGTGNRYKKGSFIWQF